MSSERRAHPRFACELDVNIETPEGLMLEGRTVDISHAGIATVCVAGVPSGSDVIFHLAIRLEGAASSALVIPGRVVWCTPFEGQFQVGGAFAEEKISEEQFNGLEVLLRFLSGELALPGA